MALGADARDILALVCRQGLLPAGAGLGIGLAASLAVNRLLASALVQVSPADPISLAAAAGALVFAAVLGSLIPARRAVRVDPIVALREA
jgi:putative ABC transport system permease protein